VKKTRNEEVRELLAAREVAAQQNAAIREHQRRVRRYDRLDPDMLYVRDSSFPKHGR
jgi:hypothetical protein